MQTNKSDCGLFHSNICMLANVYGMPVRKDGGIFRSLFMEVTGMTPTQYGAWCDANIVPTKQDIVHTKKVMKQVLLQLLMIILQAQRRPKRSIVLSVRLVL